LTKVCLVGGANGRYFVANGFYSLNYEVRVMSKFLQCALGAILLLPVAALNAADITIEITRDEQYVQTQPDGANPSPGKQFNVEVVVGQSVQWTNLDGDDHTATSDLNVRDANGQLRPLFDTQQILGNRTPPASREITFTMDHYQKAREALGVADGTRVHLGYFCANHPRRMGGKLVLYRDQDTLRRAMEADKAHEGKTNERHEAESEKSRQPQQ